MYPTSIIKNDFFNFLNGVSICGKLKKEVYFKLVAKSNFALNVLFRFNLKSIFSKIIFVLQNVIRSLAGSILINCKIQLSDLRNTLHLRFYLHLFVTVYSKLRMLFRKNYRNLKFTHTLFQITISLTENAPANEGCTIVKME
jgi:hypothetical protein